MPNAFKSRDQHLDAAYLSGAHRSYAEVTKSNTVVPLGPQSCSFVLVNRRDGAKLRHSQFAAARSSDEPCGLRQWSSTILMRAGQSRGGLRFKFAAGV